MALGERIRLDHGKGSIGHRCPFLAGKCSTLFPRTFTCDLGLILHLCSHFSMSPIEEIYPFLSQPRNVVIVMHQKPDADAMGSSLGLFHFLRQLGHAVSVISPTNWAEWLKWMPGCSGVIDYEYSTEKACLVLDKAEWVFCLDFNTLARTRHMAARLRKTDATRVLIDHHQQPEADWFD